VKKARGGDKEAKATLDMVERASALLKEGRPARAMERTPEEEPLFRQLQLLTGKPVLYVCNVDEASAADGNALSAKVAERARAEGAGHVVISAAIESEIAQLARGERADYLAELGLTETGLGRVIRAGYELLHLITYFTVGPKEARAWTISKGMRAPQAAGVIHSDFERGFIRAETIAYEDYVTLGGEAAAREAGKLRSEGKDYVVADGDIMHFRFNV
jgi:GTP-binding protein YchF